MFNINRCQKYILHDFPSGSLVNNLPAGTQVQSLDLEDPLEKKMATLLEIPWTEEPNGV